MPWSILLRTHVLGSKYTLILTNVCTMYILLVLIPLTNSKMLRSSLPFSLSIIASSVMKVPVRPTPALKAEGSISHNKQIHQVDITHVSKDRFYCIHHNHQGVLALVMQWCWGVHMDWSHMWDQEHVSWAESKCHIHQSTMVWVILYGTCHKLVTEFRRFAT